VLKNNIFEHNEQTFKQKQGTAIGTKMAPPYAILFMDFLERNFLLVALYRRHFSYLATWGGQSEAVS